MLTEHSAKMTVKNNQGDNPHNLAVLYGHTDLAKFLVLPSLKP